RLVEQQRVGGAVLLGGLHAGGGMAVVLVRAAIFASAGSLAIAHPQRGATTPSPPALDPRKTLGRQPGGGETHEYLIRLQAGQYVKLLLGQHSINLAVACFGPDGRERFAADSHNIGDTEISEMIADTTGDYRFRITAPEKTAPRGRYDITLAAV